MPMLFSPWANMALGSANDNFAFWRDVFKSACFREGDIICPMDAIGAGGCDMKYLDVWLKSYRQAVDTNGKVKYWVNSEDFENSDGITGMSALMDRFSRQIQIASKYCEKTVTFAYSHYYSPYNTMTGFNETYKQYIETGEVEKQAPVAPKNVQVKLQGSVALITWEPTTDNIGVSGYKVYRDGVMVDRIYTKRDDGNGSVPALPTDASDWDAQKNLDKTGKITYEVVAYDFAGNYSEKTSVTVTK
jgi:hypothetical protein